MIQIKSPARVVKNVNTGIVDTWTQASTEEVLLALGDAFIMVQEDDSYYTLQGVYDAVEAEGKSWLENVIVTDWNNGIRLDYSPDYDGIDIRWNFLNEPKYSVGGRVIFALGLRCYDWGTIDFTVYLHKLTADTIEGRIAEIQQQIENEAYAYKVNASYSGSQGDTMLFVQLTDVEPGSYYVSMHHTLNITNIRPTLCSLELLSIAGGA